MKKRGLGSVVCGACGKTVRLKKYKSTGERLYLARHNDAGGNFCEYGSGSDYTPPGETRFARWGEIGGRGGVSRAPLLSKETAA